MKIRVQQVSIVPIVHGNRKHRFANIADLFPVSKPIKPTYEL